MKWNQINWPVIWKLLTRKLQLNPNRYVYVIKATIHVVAHWKISVAWSVSLSLQTSYEIIYSDNYIQMVRPIDNCVCNVACRLPANCSYLFNVTEIVAEFNVIFYVLQCTIFGNALRSRDMNHCDQLIYFNGLAAGDDVVGPAFWFDRNYFTNFDKIKNFKRFSNLKLDVFMHFAGNGFIWCGLALNKCMRQGLTL